MASFRLDWVSSHRTMPVFRARLMVLIASSAAVLARSRYFPSSLWPNSSWHSENGDYGPHIQVASARPRVSFLAPSWASRPSPAADLLGELVQVLDRRG